MMWLSSKAPCLVLACLLGGCERVEMADSAVMLIIANLDCTRNLY
jgi:hypothetical protein